MGYENDPYRDENGEPLMDFDEDVHSDQDEHQQNLPDDDWGNTDRRERSPIPVYNESNPKPRKRLIKKSSSGKDSGPSDFGLDYDDGIGGDFGADDDDMAAMVRDDYSRAGKRKVDIGEKRKNVDKKSKGDRGEKKLKLRKSGGGRMRDHEADPEMKEMWDTVAGGNSEDDQEGNMTVDDNNFIDDTGVDPADRYGSDNAHSPSHAPQRFEIWTVIFQAANHKA